MLEDWIRDFRLVATRLKIRGRLNLLLQLKYKGEKGIEWC